MNKAFYIDYIRQIIYQTFEQEHINNPSLVGGETQLNLFSFYEQLANKDEVDRYVERYKELVGQQNRADLIANGIIASPENPTITNINKGLIVPLSFMCSFRLKLEDRDLMLESIDNLINIRKGRKVDIAQFDNGKLFVVGTLGNNVDGTPLIKVGDFIGEVATGVPGVTVDSEIKSLLLQLTNKGFVWENTDFKTQYLYFEKDNKLKVAILNDNNEWEEKLDTGVYTDVIFPPEHNSFTKYKVSLSFDAMRCNEPRTLDGSEYIEISFGGNATVVNNSIKLGNDLTKVCIQKDKIIVESGATDLDKVKHWLEPLEMPSGNNADTQLNRLTSNHFVANTHTDSISLSNRFTFVCDESIDLLDQWYDYGRYGTQTYITPNIIYKITEYYVSWGVVKNKDYLAKIIDSIDIENNENDVLTIAIQFQLQGANN